MTRRKNMILKINTRMKKLRRVGEHHHEAKEEGDAPQNINFEDLKAIED